MPAKSTYALGDVSVVKELVDLGGTKHAEKVFALGDVP
jgi:hypothetical protein